MIFLSYDSFVERVRNCVENIDTYLYEKMLACFHEENQLYFVLIFFFHKYQICLRQKIFKVDQPENTRNQKRADSAFLFLTSWLLFCSMTMIKIHLSPVNSNPFRWYMLSLNRIHTYSFNSWTNFLATFLNVTSFIRKIPQKNGKIIFRRHCVERKNKFWDRVTCWQEKRARKKVGLIWLIVLEEDSHY